eukprot:161104-Chlamydomonas_euryale.AAC.1
MLSQRSCALLVLSSTLHGKRPCLRQPALLGEPHGAVGRAAWSVGPGRMERWAGPHGAVGRAAQSGGAGRTERWGGPHAAMGLAARSGGAGRMERWGGPHGA